MDDPCPPTRSVTGDRQRAQHLGGALRVAQAQSLQVEVGENDRQVLCVGQESNNVDVVGAHEVPPDREALNSADPKSRNAAQLAGPW